MKEIKELLEGDKILGQMLVNNATRGVTNNGLSYMTIVFQDRSGTIEGKKWDISDEDIETFTPGNIVNVSAEVIFYKTGLQLKVYSGDKVDSKNVDIARFVTSAPIPLPDLEKKLDDYLNSLKDKDIALLTKTIIKEHYKDYVTFPAAVRNHHDFGSGILFHSLSMADLAEFVSSKHENVNRDLLIAGTLLHDMGKIVELSGPIIPKYTVEGKLLGHISIMSSIISETAERLNIKSEVPMLLQHMVLSHHGQYEFGSPVLPLTREALLLSLIDDLDAKMAVLDKAYEGVGPGEFTQKIFALEDRYFYKPKDK